MSSLLTNMHTGLNLSPKSCPLSRKGRRVPHQRNRALSVSREEHNRVQEAAFVNEREVAAMNTSTPGVYKRLQEIASSVAPLPQSARVIDVGCGTGALIPCLHETGVYDILGVDLSQPMLDVVRERYPPPSIEGNEPGVRVWKGDFVDVPNYMGPVDAVFFNAVFGNLYSPREALIRATSLMHPRGQIVVSHPMGREFHRRLMSQYQEKIPHALPLLEEWQRSIEDLPLTIKSFRNEAKLYLTVLQIPDSYGFDGAPIFMEGEVIPGKGIGSAKLGVPTANLRPDSFQELLKGKPRGVYFGWAALADGKPDEVYAAVLNLGVCPTMKEGEKEISLEAHVLHSFGENFYGKTLKVALLGFVRPEMKFSGVKQLLVQIKTDIGKATNQLENTNLRYVCQNEFFK